MENKKLLSYLLKDIEELDELFAEKADFTFDEIEKEFILTRIKGARKLVQKYIEQKEEIIEQKPIIKINEVKPEEDKPRIFEEKKSVFKEIIEKTETEAELKEKEVVQEIIIEGTPENTEDRDFNDFDNSFDHHASAPGVIVEEIVNYVDEAIAEIDNDEMPKPEITRARSEYVQQEFKLEDKPDDNNQNKRLGDSFSKEKSVNDLMTDEAVKLEHKLSNLPVTSIQAAIGINDRFQYIRELFDGNAELYNQTVARIDAMKDIQEAVVFLQGNFKWKKTEVSLKFVNLLKRRFPNE